MNTFFINPLNTNPTKWSNTLKQFVGNLPTNYLSVFGHFVGLVFKGLSESLKSNFSNKNVLITEVSLAKIFSKNICLFLKRIICTMKKEINGRPSTITTTTQRVYIILKFWLNLCSFKWLRPTYYLGVSKTLLIAKRDISGKRDIPGW